MKNFTLRPACLIASTSLLLVSITASGSTLCEIGKIKFLELAEGNESIVHISTTGTASSNPLKYRAADGTYVTRMWYGASTTRWSNRLSFLQMAYALQLNVAIHSSDYNCMGLIDEFRITLMD